MDAAFPSGVTRDGQRLRVDEVPPSLRLSGERYNPDIGFLRGECFWHPTGLPKPIHDRGVDLEDPFDRSPHSFFLTGRLAMEPSDPGRLVMAMRVTTPGDTDPIAAWTRGKWAAPRRYIVIGRACTAEDLRNQGLYGYGWSLAMCWGARRGYSGIAALVLEQFPLLSYLKSAFGFEVVRVAGASANGALTCDPGDGVPVRVLPIAVTLSSGFSLIMAEMHRIVLQKFGGRFRPTCRVGLTQTISRPMTAIRALFAPCPSGRVSA